MKRVYLLVLILLAGSPFALSATSSEPKDVTVCELMRHPNLYDHQSVRIRTRVDIQFENFGADESGCDEERLAGIWFEFADDEDTAVIYCCGDTRKHGEPTRIDGEPVFLVRDAAFLEFKDRLNAARRKPLVADYCSGRECYFYDVTATLTGVFLSGNTDIGSWGGGYGHLGCCRLFVIQKVSEVVAQRTETPAGGIYRCSKSEWTPDGDSAKKILDSADCTKILDSADRTAENCEQALVGIAANHWSDKLSHSHGQIHERTIQLDKSYTFRWHADDLRTRYSFSIPPVKSDASTEPPKILISREGCEAVVEPAPKTAMVSCRSYTDNLPFEEPEQLLSRYRMIRAEAEAGRDSWRLKQARYAAEVALADFATKTEFNLRGLEFENCGLQEHEYEDIESLYATCSWHTPDDLRFFQVTLFKNRARGERPDWNPLPWGELSLAGKMCEVEEGKSL